MDSERGLYLLLSLWPVIDLKLCDEPKQDRLAFLVGLLRVLQEQGVQVARIRGLSEEIDSALNELGIAEYVYNPGDFVIDTFGYDHPMNWELEGGPFDGAVFRVASPLPELPPAAITLEPSEDSRNDRSVRYVFRQEQECSHPDDPPIDHWYYQFENRSN